MAGKVKKQPKKVKPAKVAPAVVDLNDPAVMRLSVLRRVIPVCCGLSEAKWKEHEEVMASILHDDEERSGAKIGAFLALVEHRKVDLTGAKMLIDGVMGQYQSQEKQEELVTREEVLPALLAFANQQSNSDTIPIDKPTVKQVEAAVTEIGGMRIG